MATQRLQILDGLNFVSFKEQNLTEEQKEQARANIEVSRSVALPLPTYYDTITSSKRYMKININDMVAGVLYGIDHVDGASSVMLQFKLICDDGSEATIANYGTSSGAMFKKVVVGYATKPILYDVYNNKSYTIDMTDKSTAANVSVTSNYNVYYLGVENTEEYTPIGDYNPATKKYVDDATNVATDDEIIDMLVQCDMIIAMSDSDGSILTDEYENILTW